jgi:methionyl-tRNA formyltransferase
MSDPGIIFMGTPEFAVASLDAIIQAGYNVKGVVTSPDKPSGRGLQLHSSPVKEFALKYGLPVLQPLKLKEPGFLEALRDLRADLQVIVAFRMLPEEVWGMPPLGTFNLHASLLPQYRGAAPINWAVINGETKTGVTTFFLNHEIDKGSVIYTHEIAIGEKDAAGDVHDRLMVVGAQLVVKTIADIVSGIAVPVDQHLMDIQEPIKPAPKIFKKDCRIHWDTEVKPLYNFIRGLSPYPTAWTEMINDMGETRTAKIYACTPLSKVHNLSPGSVMSDGRQYISVAARNGFINIDRIQLQAKNQLEVEDFLRGFPKINSYRFI